MASARRLTSILVSGWLLLGSTAWAQGVEEALRAGTAALSRSAPREALQHFRQAAAKAPTLPQIQVLRGIAAEAVGEFEEALEAYRIASQQEPSFNNRLMLGMLAQRMGNTDLALQTLAAGPFEGESDRTTVMQYLFQSLLEDDRRAEALALARSEGWLREGSDYCGDVAEISARETRALLAWLLHPERAACALATAISETRSGLVRLPRLVLLDLVQRASDPTVRDKAAIFLRHRLPGHQVAKAAESLNIAGFNLWNRDSNAADAVQAFERAIAADPKFSWPYSSIGWVHGSQGNHQQALEWYRKAVAINPDHWRAHVGIGASAASLKRWEEARQAYQRAVALNPEDASSYRGLAWVLVRIGHEADAIQAFQAAVKLMPTLQEEREYLTRKLGTDPLVGATPFVEPEGGPDPSKTPTPFPSW